MYTEEPRRTINWGNLIKKGLIIILVAAIIFFVIWLISRNNSNAINVNYDGNNTNNTTEKLNSNSYSEIFIDNYRYFHDTAKEYFLISNLPEKGKTIKFTLQELIDKKLILLFSYTDKESCDTEASYVSVKNTDGKYTMTTTLVCGQEVASTKEELGCNQICVDKVCECKCDNNTTTNTEKVTEYQYKQAYKANETTYSCKTGYTKVGTGENTKCVKTDKNTIEATKTVTYNCDNGYTKVGTGENTTCVKDDTKTVNAKVTYTYSCPENTIASGEGENLKCYTTDSYRVKADVSYTYTCDTGYTKSGSGESTKCTKTTTKTIPATPKTTYSCSSGTLSGTKCVSSSSYTTNATANTTYSCTKGTLYNEKYCKVAVSSSKYQAYDTYKGSIYQGCTYSGSYTESCGKNCTKTKYKYYCSTSSYNIVDATPKTTYSCSEGTLSGTKCVVTITKTIAAEKTAKYSCDYGVLS